MPENDQYPLYQIYFYLVDGCNLRCRHCWMAAEYGVKGRTNTFLPVETFRSVVEQAIPLGLTGVKLTGGEPLLHPDILEILGIIRERGLALNVETNGVLVTREIAEAIASCKGRFVSVSLDGPDAPTHEWVRGVAGSFDGALRGIGHLTAAGIRPQVIMSVIRRNSGQEGALVRLAESVGAGSVKFNVVQPTARGEDIYSSGEALTVKEAIDLGRYVEGELSKSSAIPLHYSYPLAFRSLGRLFGAPGNCAVCGILGIIGVLADGSYALCGIGKTVPDLVFGSAAADQLEAVWRTSATICQIREGLPSRLEGVCRDCLMKHICKGSCIAQNYYSRGSLWAPHWFCEEARAQGCFPETRIK